MHNSTWLWNIARGINGDEVESRVLPKSHGTGKTFPGRNCLKTIDGASPSLFCSDSCIFCLN